MTETPGSQPPQLNPSTAPMPPYASAIYPPPKQGPSTLKIVLIIVGIFFGIALIGAGFLAYGVYKVVKSSHMTAGTQVLTEADLGVPGYPGAEQGKSVRMTIVGKDMLTASFLTSDAEDRVIAFYQNSLGPGARVTTTSRGETLQLQKGADETVIVTITETASVANGKTQIVIMHATKAAAQSN